MPGDGDGPGKAEPLTDRAEEWSECASRLFAGTPEGLRSSSDWTKSASVRSKLRTSELRKLCEEWQADCDSGGSKKSMIQALLKVQLGPDVPEKGVRMCHPGIAMGYDVALRNPASMDCREVVRLQTDTERTELDRQRAEGLRVGPCPKGSWYRTDEP